MQTRNISPVREIGEGGAVGQGYSQGSACSVAKVVDGEAAEREGEGEMERICLGESEGG